MHRESNIEALKTRPKFFNIIFDLSHLNKKEHSLVVHLHENSHFEMPAWIKLGLITFNHQQPLIFLVRRQKNLHPLPRPPKGLSLKLSISNSLIINGEREKNYRAIHCFVE